MLTTAALFASLIALIIASRFAFGLISRMEKYSMTREIIENNNHAVGLRFALFFLGVVFSFLNILHPSGLGLQEDLNIIGLYGSLAIALLLVSKVINDKAILYALNNNSQVVAEKNAAVASVEGATFLASAFVMSGALAGWEGGLWVSLGWFGIGQAFLILLGLLYRTTARNLDTELVQQNQARALSFGGFLLSGGIALGSAISGPFSSWTEDLKAVTAYLLAWLVVMVVTHFIVNRLVVPSTKLSTEIAVDSNVGAGAIEAAAFVAITLFFVKIW